MSSWGNMVEGAKCTTGCTKGIPGTLNPAYAAARDAVNGFGIESGTGSPPPAPSNKNSKGGPRI